MNILTFSPNAKEKRKALGVRKEENSMSHEETLTGLIDKLRRNREKVPLDVLKTKYAAAYSQLCDSIKEELKRMAVRWPSWLEGRKIRKDYIDEMIDLFNRLYDEGGYSKKLGRAAFKNMDPAEAIRITNEIAANFETEVEKLVSSKSCLYATQPCWNPESPEKPKIYNDLLRMFWDDDRQGWREPEPGETEPAILIFLNKGEQKE